MAEYAAIVHLHAMRGRALCLQEAYERFPAHTPQGVKRSSSHLCTAMVLTLEQICGWGCFQSWVIISETRLRFRVVSMILSCCGIKRSYTCKLISLAGVECLSVPRLYLDTVIYMYGLSCQGVRPENVLGSGIL